MAQRRCAAPRIADEPVLVPLRASPRRRSTRPGCENALPDAERCLPRSHRGGAPTPPKPLRSGCIWRSAGALHPAVRTSWCSPLPGDHRTVGAPAPGAKTCLPRSHRGGAPCMLRRDQLIRLLTSYRGGRMLLEAAWTDLVCRVAPRLITNLEEYPEAGLARLRMTRSRRHQVRDRGTGNYCDRKSAEGELI